MASAAILAGGRARRFGGRDKSMIRVEGRTILERQLDVLREVSSDIFLVRSSMEAGFSQSDRGTFVEAGLSRPDFDVRIIHDRVADCGPLGALDAALAAARDDELIVVAGDMPFVDGSLLRHLCAQLSDEIDAVVPRSERGYHPLCAVYRRRCHAAVKRRLERQALTLMGLIDELQVRVVVDLAAFGTSERLLANVNTPAELDRVEALLGHEA